MKKLLLILLVYHEIRFHGERQRDSCQRKDHGCRKFGCYDPRIRVCETYRSHSLGYGTALHMDMTLPISAGKSFEGTIKNLSEGKYYFRSYAHNTQGTAYGEGFSFTIMAAVFRVI